MVRKHLPLTVYLSSWWTDWPSVLPSLRLCAYFIYTRTRDILISRTKTFLVIIDNILFLEKGSSSRIPGHIHTHTKKNLNFTFKIKSTP